MNYQSPQPLTASESDALEKLTEQRRTLENTLREARKEVSEALKRRNAIARQLKQVNSKWLPLMEKKYGT